MAIKNIIYTKDGCPFASCEQGKFTLQVGEELKIELEPKNPDWDESFVAEVKAVTPSSAGWDYTIEFDDAVLNGAIMFEGCDIASITPYCCCEKLGDKVDDVISGDIPITTTASSITDFNEAVVSALDTNADGTFTAEDIAGIADFISDQIASGDITISASDVSGFCAEVASCLSTDAGVQSALANLLANNPAVNNALDDVISDAIENDADVVQALADSITDNTVVQDAINDALANALGSNPALQAAVLAILDPNGDGIMDALNVDVSSLTGLVNDQIVHGSATGGVDQSPDLVFVNGRLGVGTDTPARTVDIREDAPVQRITDTNAVGSTETNAFYEFRDSNDSQMAYLGLGSTLNDTFTVRNFDGGIDLVATKDIQLGSPMTAITGTPAYLQGVPVIASGVIPQTDKPYIVLQSTTTGTNTDVERMSIETSYGQTYPAGAVKIIRGPSDASDSITIKHGQGSVGNNMQFAHPNNQDIVLEKPTDIATYIRDFDRWNLLHTNTGEGGLQYGNGWRENHDGTVSMNGRQVSGILQNTEVIITLPIGLSSSAYTVLATPWGQVGEYGGLLQIVDRTTTTFTVRNTGSDRIAFMWVLEGGKL